MQILQTIWNIISVISVLFTVFFLIGLIRNIRRELDIVGQAKELAKTTKLVYVEQVNGMYLMHDKITHHFVAQAETELELWKIARERFPTKNIMTMAEDKEVKVL